MKLLHKLLCLVGIHRWIYRIHHPDERWCRYCRKQQFWLDEDILDGFAGISPGMWITEEKSQ